MKAEATIRREIGRLRQTAENQKILALDIATKCGWAHSNGAGGTWDLSIRKDESSGMRLIRFEAKLLEIMAVGVDVIAFETPTVAQGKRANMDGLKLGTKLQAIIERLCEKTGGLECLGRNLQTIKAHALRDQPKGSKRDKEAMVAAAERRWPNEVIVDDNHADALFLLSLVTEELNGRRSSMHPL